MTWHDKLFISYIILGLTMMMVVAPITYGSGSGSIAIVIFILGSVFSIGAGLDWMKYKK